MAEGGEPAPKKYKLSVTELQLLQEQVMLMEDDEFDRQLEQMVISPIIAHFNFAKSYPIFKVFPVLRLYFIIPGLPPVRVNCG